MKFRSASEGFSCALGGAFSGALGAAITVAFALVLHVTTANAQSPAPPQVPQVKGAQPPANLIEPNSGAGQPGAGQPGAQPSACPGAQPGLPNAGTALQTDAISQSLFAGLMDPFEYDPRGRKDPFVQPIPEKALAPGSLHGPILPLQAYNLEQLRLVGIIWDVRHPKAMIKDPDGKTHIVGPNTKLGPKNGYIAVIREGEMVVVETTEQMGKLVSTAQVVKIAK